MQTYYLGQEIDHKDQKWLVVRIISSNSLFANADGTHSKVDEVYIQIRSANGHFDHIILYEDDQRFNLTSNINALPPVPWRKNGKILVQAAGS